VFHLSSFHLSCFWLIFFSTPHLTAGVIVLFQPNHKDIGRKFFFFYLDIRTDRRPFPFPPGIMRMSSAPGVHSLIFPRDGTPETLEHILLPGTLMVSSSSCRPCGVFFGPFRAADDGEKDKRRASTTLHFWLFPPAFTSDGLRHLVWRRRAPFRSYAAYFQVSLFLEWTLHLLPHL